jgi:hypothetical protein
MSRIPYAKELSKALKSVQKATQKALQGTNLLASQRMAKGDYQAAEALAARGKEIRQFKAEVQTLEKRWREVSRGGARTSKKSLLPLWEYFQPILKALVQSGGASRLSDLEAQVQKILSGSLQPGDRVILAGGRERWRVMVRRSRKALVAEGWIEEGPGPLWRITDAGRRAAETPITESRDIRK